MNLISEGSTVILTGCVWIQGIKLRKNRVGTNAISLRGIVPYRPNVLTKFSIQQNQEMSKSLRFRNLTASSRNREVAKNINIFYEMVVWWADYINICMYFI